MTEQIPPLADDESQGDQADQASRLQMLEEQAAIQAALAGNVEGTDALDDRWEVGDALEGPDPLDGTEVDGSDDPVYGGGMPVLDPSEAGTATPGDDSLDAELGVARGDDDTVFAVDEGGTNADDEDGATLLDDDDDAALDFDLDETEPLDELLPPDEEAAAEDLDALISVSPLGHDLDDPQNPDGYGVPPADDAGTAVIDEARHRDPIADA